MQIFSSPGSLKAYISKERNQGKTVGLVPTMGALHSGHIELIGKCVESNDITICSIYVNPTQFNDRQDLIRYPRDQDHDIFQLEAAGCQATFCPSDEVMYSTKPMVSLNFGPLENLMEGHHRPGHFKGVALIVAKLLNMTQPDQAYFGEKDWQQLIIIKQLVQDLNFPVRIVGVPIVREPDGLAMSSRNQRLSSDERIMAPELYNCLQLVTQQLVESTNLDQAITKGKEYLLQFPGIKLDYLEIVRASTLDHLVDEIGSEPLSVCIAAFLGEVRLIDNMQIFID